MIAIILIDRNRHYSQTSQLFSQQIPGDSRREISLSFSLGNLTEITQKGENFDKSSIWSDFNSVASNRKVIFFILV